MGVPAIVCGHSAPYLALFAISLAQEHEPHKLHFSEVLAGWLTSISQWEVLVGDCIVGERKCSVVVCLLWAGVAAMESLSDSCQ